MSQSQTQPTEEDTLPEWYKNWWNKQREKPPADSRRERRRKETLAKELNKKVSELATVYFESMERYEKMLLHMEVDAYTRKGYFESHREALLKGLDRDYRDWLSLRRSDYVYDECVNLLLQKIIDISASQAKWH